VYVRTNRYRRFASSLRTSFTLAQFTGPEEASSFYNIILSEAKNLLLFAFKEIQQMLRCAQHDSIPFSASC
jgi:hypothetical protein